ncbi:hypothetical protein [Polycladidibacter hongkongensis]|uniref:hypothetical protein n=1 Tax=Polycladidibacter hongkongensis TaxID=1647556 RepID=UPI00082FCC00|nr:hypothetical protein [Pseudovibrio hongkongensis]
MQAWRYANLLGEREILQSLKEIKRITTGDWRSAGLDSARQADYRRLALADLQIAWGKLQPKIVSNKPNNPIVIFYPKAA